MLRLTVASAALLLASVAVPAYAQGPAECKPVSAAMTKLFTTDHANTTTTNGKTSQGIMAGGAMYIQYNGVWRKSPLTAQAMQKQEEENIRTAKNYTCKALPDDAVGGVAASVYQTHSESDAGTSDAKIWIGKATGLPLKTEENLDAVGKMTIVYSYTNIHAPVVK